MNAGNGNEVIGERRGDTQRKSRSHAVTDADLRSPACSWIRGNLGKDGSGVCHDLFRRNARGHTHHSFGLSSAHSLRRNLAEVKRQAHPRTIEEVRSDAIVAIRSEPACVLLELLAVSDTV